MREKQDFEREYNSVFKILEQENKKDIMESKMSRTGKPESNFG